MMKRIVATLFFLSLILVGLALVAPSLIDWSQHKDRLIAQLKPYLGRSIDVGGQVSFRLVPNPRILLEDVTLSNAEGAKADHFMKLKQLEASMKLQPLLQGRFEVEAINLDQPELDLEVLDDGSNNWSGILKERQEGGGLENAADTIQFNQITMTNGTLHYLNQVTGASWQVDKLNLTVSADTLFGPYRVAGDMQYKGTKVAVEAGTGKFGGASVPLHLAFNPTETLPQVKLDGTMDSQAGLAVQGDLTIGQGNVASLFESDFLKKIEFLNEDTDLTGSLDLKGGEAKITNIKAKYGKKGDLSGSVTVAFEKGKKPVVAADLTGTALKVTSKSGFMSVPDGFDAHLKLKGKSVTWNGINLPAVSVAIDTDKEEWVVKNGRFDLPGKSVIKVAGVVTPKTKYAAYSLQVTTEDFPLMLKSLPLGEGNLLKLAGDSQLFKALDIAGSLDLRSDKASFSDIDGAIGGKVKVSGVLDVVLDDKIPSFKANLNLDDADMAAFSDEGWKAFTAGVLKTTGSMEIAAKNFSSGDVKLSTLSLNGATGTGGVQIKDLSGTFADGGDFALNGTVASLNPASGLDITYRVKTQSPGAAAKALSIGLPPPLKTDALVDLHGRIVGDAKKCTFNAEGHGLTLNGTQEATAEGGESYQTAVHLDKPDNGGVFALLGLPIDALVGYPKVLDGDLSGSRTNYKVSKLAAGDVSGSLERKGDKFSGDLTTAALDLDEWLTASGDLKTPFSLKLKAKTLAWRSDEVVFPELTLVAEPDSLHVQGLTGQMWGGDLTAEAEGHRKGDLWNGTLKGSLKGADLGKLATLMKFRGFSVGSGGLDFDLTSDGEKEKDQWFHGVDGKLDMKASELTVKGFAPADLAGLINGLKGPSEDLAGNVLKALMSGDTKYNDVNGSFAIADGKINIQKLVLSDGSAKVDVKGAYDMGPETFHLTGDIKQKSVSDLPSIGLSRSGNMKDAPDYSVNIAALQEYLAKRVAKDEANAPVPVAPEAETPPVISPAPNLDATPGDQRVLLKHQGEETPSVTSVPAPTPAPVVDDAHPSPLTPDDARPTQLTPDTTSQPPTLPTPSADDNNGGRIDVPIETEPLAAPPVPPPAPAQQAPPANDHAAQPVPAPAPADHAAIKGILDRLNDGSDATKPTETPDKPAATPEDAPAEDEPVKP